MESEESRIDARTLSATVERLAQVYKTSGADTMELDCDILSLRFAKKPKQPLMQECVTLPTQSPAHSASDPQLTAPAEAPSTAEACTDPALTQVKAPLVGVFYAAPAPDAAPFVTEGQHVNKGDVLCIIEAMKFMNEICAPCDGTVELIRATNGKALSFDEVIMEIRS